MNTATIRENNIHPLCDFACRLITIFKTAIGYREVARIENSIKCNLTKLNKVLLGTLKNDIIQRVKQHFDIILEAIITSFILPRQRQYTASWKPFIQETFDSFVEYVINIESRMLLDKKQDLLGDLHTQLTNEMTSQMLKNQLLPTYIFKSEGKLEEMARQQSQSAQSSMNTHRMTDREKYNEKQNVKLQKVLQDVCANFDDIPLPVIIEMMKRKKERNNAKHYDNKIRAHIKTKQGQTRELKTFLESQGLLRAFDDMEISRSQKMYSNHCEIISTDWHNRSYTHPIHQLSLIFSLIFIRFQPGEHIWFYTSNNNRVSHFV